jgi:hypothetical protein
MDQMTNLLTSGATMNATHKVEKGAKFRLRRDLPPRRRTFLSSRFRQPCFFQRQIPIFTTLQDKNKTSHQGGAVDMSLDRTNTEIPAAGPAIDAMQMPWWHQLSHNSLRLTVVFVSALSLHCKVVLV